VHVYTVLLCGDTLKLHALAALCRIHTLHSILFTPRIVFGTTMTLHCNNTQLQYDRLLWFVLLMQGCMPSAQNSVVILQMEKDPAAGTYVNLNTYTRQFIHNF
jgi:predicted permease